MWVRVAIGAFAVAEPVPNRLCSASKPFLPVARPALQIGMHAFERIGRNARVVEGLDLEGGGGVTRVAGALWVGETELPSMGVTMAARALAWSAAVGRALPLQSVLLGRTMAAVARGSGVGTGERPYTVVDPRGAPPTLRVARGAPSLAHLHSELLTMRVVVTIGTSRRRKLEF
jgi:hypothetical protein